MPAHHKNGSAGQEDKDGRAKMCNPPCKKKRGCGGGQIGGTCSYCACILERGFVKEIAHVIKRHDHHYKATQYINRLDPCPCSNRVSHKQCFKGNSNYEELQ